MVIVSLHGLAADAGGGRPRFGGLVLRLFLETADLLLPVRLGRVALVVLGEGVSVALLDLALAVARGVDLLLLLSH